MNRIPRVRIPLAQRWREVRIRVVPAVVFVGTLSSILYLWREQISPPTLIGEVESVTADVFSPDPGVLTNLWVIRFQTVHAGDVVAEIAGTSDFSLDAVVQSVRGRTALAQLDLIPALDRQRAAIDYHRLRLDYLEQRVSLATTRVNLRRAQNELKRDAELFQQKLISADQFDLTAKTEEALRAETDEKTRLVDELEGTLEHLGQVMIANSGTNAAPAEWLSGIESDRVRLARISGDPLALRSPIDGVVTAIHRRAGESVRAAEPIVTISAVVPERIIGYLRQPIRVEPTPGTLVKVRRRSLRREEAWGQVLAVGGQYESIKKTLLRPGVATEVGLPISISPPGSLGLRPGEIVDLTLREH